jgi:hypothetical protein
MAKVLERLCNYGNCDVHRTEAVVRMPRYLTAPSYCCFEHAALALLSRKWGYTDPTFLEVERIVLKRMGRAI